ncbi:GGDEF domain-containing protein [Turneriella parva]|uniref:diguanylate cyclase n=1 Tax=Turneriella parva (strain ATCC BAA-1111 / DSM 21527 / NCTC 11395 / H) TaxID=869212 RepID=I4B3A1_TURPD|nr:GGDEF domain-containing protein [Turneriella parva]AFM11758.1 diguanylate cyclase [Turneriella parva DSM 21527]
MNSPDFLSLKQALVIFFVLTLLLNLFGSFVTWLATKTRATRWWAISALLALSGLLFLVVHTQWPNPAFILLQNLSYAVSLALVSAGMRDFHGRKYSPKADVIVIGLSLVAVAGAIWIKDSFALRVAINSALFAYYAFLAASILWRGKGSIKAIYTFASVSWFLYGLINLVRAALAFAGIGIDDSQPFVGVTYLMVFLFGPVCITGGYIGLIMLVVQKLLDEKHDALRVAEKLANEYRELSDHDPLTNALNNRSFSQSLERERARCVRENRPLSVVMADLDHFKIVNDTYGHSVGDATLKQAVALWRSQLRAPDLLGRVGGEEFVIILPHADLQHAARVAERLRQKLEAQTDGLPAKITASFGVTQARQGEPTHDLLRRVDAAMYGAKAAGRNRVVAV